MRFSVAVAVLVIVAAIFTTCEAKQLPVNPVCHLPKGLGHCTNYVPRYYYDIRTWTCTTFNYGGCGGNENNFETYAECRWKCRW
ncbi:hypothetical protein SNE40_012352 [Patella caerulea]|uniref:BPTI/Kunitz inhibitor domain-containing protein n=1 Tax=Patella caerulea TaxID=87958 RepID=A0AAN8JLL1_PATCE